MVGLVVPSDNEDLLNASGANTAYSPFIIAMRLAGIKVLPSIFNAVITISVLSVANSCAYGSTRTMQALAQTGMAPKFMAYVDKQGRPIWCVVIQLAFGLLAFVNEKAVGSTFFNWLLALSGLANFVSNFEDDASAAARPLCRRCDVYATMALPHPSQPSRKPAAKLCYALLRPPQRR